MDNTKNYDLTQYQNGDKPDFRQEYNSDMAKIDAALYEKTKTVFVDEGGVVPVQEREANTAYLFVQERESTAPALGIGALKVIIPEE